MRFIHSADWQIGKVCKQFGAKEETLRQARLTAIERLKNDERLLREKAQRLREGAGATVQGYRDQIAALEDTIRQAEADGKRDKVDARDLDKKADAVKARVDALQRELDRAAVAEPVTA